MQVNAGLQSDQDEPAGGHLNVFFEKINCYIISACLTSQTTKKKKGLNANHLCRVAQVSGPASTAAE